MTCHLCGRDRFQRLPVYYIWEAKRFDLLQCRSCRLVTVEPKPTDDELVRLYAAEYFEHGAHGLDRSGESYEDVQRRTTIAERVELLRTKILAVHPGARSLFEVGAAMGHLLDAARSLGLTVSGVEISSAAKRRAKDLFGLDLHEGDLETLDLDAEFGKWDCVLLGDVFEHFRNPGRVVDKIHDLLAPGGIAYVIIPSTWNLFSTRLALGLLRLTGKERRLPDDPVHLYEYTTSTIRAMFARRFADVRVINSIKKPSELNLKSGSSGYRIKWVVHLINYPYTRLLGRNGDRLTVIARKG